MILEHVLDQIAPGRKPCEFFDLIGGSGFGGITALLLGRLQLSIPEAMNALQDLILKVWVMDNDDWTVDSRTEEFERQIERVLNKYYHYSQPRLLSPQACGSMVLANSPSNMNAKIPTPFTTYHRRIRPPAPHLTVNQAIRATTSHRLFFHDLVISEGPVIQSSYFGTDYANGNPTAAVFKDFQDIWPDDAIGCIISIGAGNPGPFKLDSSTPDTYLESLLSLCEDNEKYHLLNRKLFENTVDLNSSQSIPYFRFNVDHGLERRPPGDTAFIPDIRASVNKYLELVQTDKLIDDLCLRYGVERVVRQMPDIEESL
ncbi:hypothetical protein DL96DRAFT_1663834, partial [Flagelloscypha sp. PMI_526]